MVFPYQDTGVPLHRRFSPASGNQFAKASEGGLERLFLDVWLLLLETR
jgi:hypothetical protein